MLHFALLWGCKTKPTSNYKYHLPNQHPIATTVLSASWRFLHLGFFHRAWDFFAFRGPRPICYFLGALEPSMLLFPWICCASVPGDLVRIIIKVPAMLLFHKSAVWDFSEKIPSAKILTLYSACLPGEQFTRRAYYQSQ